MTGQPRTLRLPPREWRALLAAAVIYAVLIAIVVAWRAESTSDFRDFWENAVHFRQTGEISTALGVHNYLPFFTIFMLPWGLLPLHVAIVVFTLLSLGLFGVTVYLAESLLNDTLRRGPRLALLLSIVLVLPYVHSCAVLGNVGLLVLFLIVTAWYLLERGRDTAAGCALGLAILIKLLPGVLLVFLLLKRRWHAAGAAAAVIVVLGLGLPLLAVGGSRTVQLHREFYGGAVQGGSALATLTAGQPQKAMYSNNAVPIVLRRLLTPLDGGKEATGPLRVNVTDLPRPALVSLYLALMALFTGGCVAATFWGAQRWPPEDADGVRALRAQFGAWCCLMLLASPLVWTHYLPLAYWPLALLSDHVIRAWRVQHRAPRGAVVTLSVWLAAIALLAWPAARAAGAQIAAVVVLWIAMIGLSRRTSP